LDRFEDYGTPPEDEEHLIDDFNWDEDKAAGNEGKHGVSFEEAASCFHDTDAKIFRVNRKGGEIRFALQGTSNQGRPLIVIFTYRTKENERIAWIISAQKMMR
jgi:uncharacterized protein